jgi:hypothetical protein
MARDGGVRPCLQQFNPRASYVPEELREQAGRHAGCRALFYTRQWEGCWLKVAVFPDGTELFLLK